MPGPFRVALVVSIVALAIVIGARRISAFLASEVAIALGTEWVTAIIIAGVSLIVCVASGYFALVTRYNHTTIRATREWLWTRHGPLPIVGANVMDAFGFWPDVQDVRVPASQLVWVAKAERSVIDLVSEDGDLRSTKSKVFLKAAYQDGADIAEAQLLPSPAPDAVEDFIGWQLDEWLLRAKLPLYKGAASLSQSS